MIRKIKTKFNSSTLKACTFALSALFVLAFGLLSVLPMGSFASADSGDDFDAFSAALMSMQTAYPVSDVVLSEDECEIDGDEVLISKDMASSLSLSGDSAGDGLVSLAYSTTEDGEISVKSSSMRLIVYSEENVPSNGAVMSAEYRNWHIFQYDSVEAAESAYEILLSAEFDVSFDEYVTVDYTVVDSEDSTTSTETTSSEVSATSATNPWASGKTFNSWGADFVGYSTFVSNIYARHTDEEIAAVGNIYVAVLDSGIYAEHEIFYDSNGTEAGRIATEYAKNFDTQDYNLNTDDPHYTDSTMYGDTEGYYEYRDYCGHGTHVSGTIAESTTDNVLIIPVKILNYEGGGMTSAILEGLEYLVTLIEDGVNLKVANMSVGVDLSSSSSSSTTSSKIAKAVEAAYNAGIVCVVSAGNNSTSTEYASPANVDCAITVSALRQSGSSVTFASSYSNYGPQVDFSAPGSAITSAGIDGYQSTSTLYGTSMAAPHVTAAVALIFCEPMYANYTPAQVLTLLSDNAKDLGEEGWDEYYGYGMIYLAEIGVNYEAGYVEFLDSEGNTLTGGDCTEEIEVTLSYSAPSESTDCVIKYTLDENQTDYDSETWLTYSAPITISETTRISAIAIVTYEGGTTKRTYTATIDFTFGTDDLLTNYTFTKLSTGLYEITSYNGSFTELTLPSTYNNTRISTLGDYFLRNTLVSIVHIPDSISIIDVNAFRSNSTLTEVDFISSDSWTSATSLVLGNYAFYNCKNLTSLNFGGQDEVITTIGTHAFAYSSNIDSFTLKLLSVTTIGRHAFSYSSLSTLWLGYDFVSIGEQIGLSISTIYAYSTNDVAMQFVEDFSIDDFHDLAIYLYNFPTFTVFEAGDYMIFETIYSGEEDVVFMGYEFYELVFYYGQWYYYDITSTMDSYYIGYNYGTIDNDGETLYVYYDYYYPLQTQNGYYTGTIIAVATFTDISGSTVYSSEIEVIISSSVYTLTIESGDSNVFINDSYVYDTVTLVQGQSYDLYVEADSGYKISSVTVGSDTLFTAEEGVEETETTQTFSATEDCTLTVTTAYKDYLVVSFDATYSGEQHATILVDGVEVSDGSIDVEREGTLQFTIRPDKGYSVSSVWVNGVEIEPENGVYTIENVTEDMSVEIEFEVQSNSVSLVYGKNCGTVDWSGSSNLVVGESKTYTVTASDGYAVDSVTVNNEEVEVTSTSSGVYTFTITNTGESSEDLVVEISFKKDNNLEQIMTYFIIFCALFVFFAISSLILILVRKKDDVNQDLRNR